MIEIIGMILACSVVLAGMVLFIAVAAGIVVCSVLIGRFVYENVEDTTRIKWFGALVGGFVGVFVGILGLSSLIVAGGKLTHSLTTEKEEPVNVSTVNSEPNGGILNEK